MEDKKLVAEALLDIAKNSTTEFIEITVDSELIETAKKFNIVLPSPDLSVIKTVYAEIDKVNRNGVILPKEAVEKGLPTLIGKQINWEHQGSGRICGYIIDAKINNDLIEITGVIFKSLFPEEMEMVKDKFKKKDLCVSFEIWNRTEDGTSVVHELKNGFRSIDPIIFHGCGLLLANKPACPKAYVYKLVAKVLNETEKIVEKVFGEDLIFASSAIEESKCKGCNPCTCEQNKEEKIMIKCEKCGKDFEVSAEEKICVECASLPKEEPKTQSSEETQVEVKATETKTEEKSEVAETKVEETKTEETKEEVVVEEKKEEATIVTTTQEVTKVDEIKPEGEIITTEVKTETVVVNDNGKETQKVEEEIKTVVTYTFEQVQEQVKTAEEELVAAMPKEVSDRIKELMKDGKSMKEAMKQAWDEYKSKADLETSDLKTVTENLDKEIKKLQDELGKKDQEIAELKTPKVEEKKEKEMTVGAVEGEKQTEIKRQAAEVNKIIASKRDKK